MILNFPLYIKSILQGQLRKNARKANPNRVKKFGLLFIKK